jgi:hypothetical protein
MTRPDSREARHCRPPSLHRSPADARTAPAEEYLDVVGMRAGTGVAAPDFLAVVAMYVGDELHHSGGTAARPRATRRTART